MFGISVQQACSLVFSWWICFPWYRWLVCFRTWRYRSLLMHMSLEDYVLVFGWKYANLVNPDLKIYFYVCNFIWVCALCMCWLFSTILVLYITSYWNCTSQSNLKNVHSICSTQAYLLLKDQLAKAKADVVQYQTLYEKLQVISVRLSRCAFSYGLWKASVVVLIYLSNLRLRKRVFTGGKKNVSRKMNWLRFFIDHQRLLTPE